MTAFVVLAMFTPTSAIPVQRPCPGGGLDGSAAGINGVDMGMEGSSLPTSAAAAAADDAATFANRASQTGAPVAAEVAGKAPSVDVASH